MPLIKALQNKKRPAIRAFFEDENSRTMIGVFQTVRPGAPVDLMFK
jgi:hypothetical protein